MILLYISLLILSFLLTYLVRIIAIKKSIIDHPNERSSHTVPTPRGGGIAIAITWYIGICCFYIMGLLDSRLFFALLSGIPLVIIGFLDDVINLKAGIRFLVQFICAVLAIIFLKGFQIIDIGFGKFELNSNLILFILFNVVAVIAIVWAINLFNFLDGLDGYLGAEAVFLGASIFLLAGDKLGILLGASTLGFLFWNWQKAKIFMGDVGSTMIGFTIAVIAIYHQNIQSINLPLWLILTAVFWLDATITLFRRIKNKEKLSVAHRKHAFQRIVQAGFSHQKTVIYSLIFNLIGLILVIVGIKMPVISMLLSILFIFFLFLVIKKIDKLKAFE